MYYIMVSNVYSNEKGVMQLCLFSFEQCKRNELRCRSSRILENAIITMTIKTRLMSVHDTLVQTRFWADIGLDSIIYCNTGQHSSRVGPTGAYRYETRPCSSSMKCQCAVLVSYYECRFIKLLLGTVQSIFRNSKFPPGKTYEQRK